ncbi:MAG: hypothetical protein Fur0012_05790 [Elusimicrobiota bacterium]
MKKALLLIYAFLLFSCSSRKDGLSVYLTSDINSLIWDHGEGIYSLREKIDSDTNKKIILETGDFFSPRHPENAIDSWNSAIKAAKLFGIDGICAENSLLKIENSSLPREATGMLLASNAYLKSRKEFNPMRIVCSSPDSSICAVSVYVPDISNPEKPAYIKDYRIENPLYEINKNLSRIKDKKNFSLLSLIVKDFNGKKSRKILSSFVEKLSVKPDLLTINSGSYFEPFKCRNIWVAPSVSDALAIRLFVYEIPILKIKKLRLEKIFPSAKSKRGPAIKEMEALRQAKFAIMSKKYSRAAKDFPRKSDSSSPLARLMARIISSYIKSNGAFYHKEALNRDLKEGDVYLKDIYEILPQDDRLIYCKIKGHDLEKMIQSADLTSLEYYPFEINDKREIHVKGEAIKKDKLYRILIPQSAVDGDYSLLSYSMEFSVLPKTTLDAALWYFRTHRVTE